MSDGKSTYSMNGSVTSVIFRHECESQGFTRALSTWFVGSCFGTKVHELRRSVKDPNILPWIFNDLQNIGMGFCYIGDYVAEQPVFCGLISFLEFS